MEDKKTIKIGMGSFIFIILIIVIITAGAIFGCSYYIANTINRNENNNEIKVENIIENGNKTNAITNEIQQKVYNEDDWVIPANYENKLSIFSYTTLGNDTYKISDIKVPYININSEDAKQTNEEIEKTYKELIQEFEENANEDETMSYTVASYKSYINKDILSVVIEVEKGGTYLPIYEYYTYNFNLKTLELCDYDEIFKVSGNTQSNIKEKLEKAIKEIEEVQGLEEDMKKEPINTGIQYYNKSVKDSSLQYYLDNNNKLNIVVEIEIQDLDPSEFTKIITIK